jgi:UDP-N-acetylmuramate: L-alanyl-gamma-D-glutamyl-meso-diaminopimelate ligase
MLTTSPIRRVHLSGICGTAMASLAGMLQASGYQVSGSDAAVYPPMSTFLESLGIPVAGGFDAAHVREARPDLVVIGNALSRGNAEVEYVLDSGLRYASLAETLRELFIRGRRAVVVAGTHGKTTTTARLAWLLASAGRDPSFMVGGIAGNFGTSFRIGGGPDFVIEGDEYDTAFFDKGPKFLHYLPHIALVKNIEFDHADIYADLAAIQLAFRRLLRLVPSSGLVVAGVDSPAVREVLDPVWSPVAGFGLGAGEWRADGIEARGPATVFDVVREGRLWHRFEIPLVGRFNVLNALSAVVAADALGLEPDEIATGLASFRNARRRLEIRGEVAGVVVYDDFAHHPTAVGETLAGMRESFPDARIWAVFEPRSQTSRRSVFEPAFAAALGRADAVVVAPVFAGEKLGGESLLSPARVVEEIARGGGEAWAPGSTDQIVALVAEKARRGDRIVVMSNGGFDNIHQRLLDALAARA